MLDENINLSYHSYRALKPSFSLRIQKEYADMLPEIEAIPGNIARVLLNILNNACFAVHEKQQKAGEKHIPTLTVRTGQSGGYIYMYIRDNGNGIPNEIRQQVFQPFFTTKPAGAGNSGLGLSISHDIVVKEHHGHLEVISKVGGYTEFQVFLPIRQRVS